MVAYTGDPWRTWAHQRAIPSAEALGVPVVVGEGSTVADARNDGLSRVSTEWVVHLDADDELEPGYVEAMATGTADLRAPVVRYIHAGGQRTQPGMPRVAGHRHACTGECLPEGNWLVVGACARADLLRKVGGWWGEPIYEDWSLWLRCWLAGATVEPVPSAIYRAHVRPRSRNRALPMVRRNEIHHQILRSVGL